jgi:L-iditol 2-dehydrogenase
VKIQAFALYGKEDLRAFEWDAPALDDSGVLLRVNSCGICGSDLRMFYDGPSPRYRLPVVLGHEFTGTVTEAGPKVKDLQPGDVVAVAPLIPCMNCRPCRHGQDNLCENGLVIGVHVPGGMADHFYVPGQMVNAGGLAKVPASADVRSAALTEIVACCLHGLRQTEFKLGDSVLIIGEGPVGLTHLQLLRLMGAGEVVVTGLVEKRLRLAEELGASMALDVGKHDLKKFAEDKAFKPDLAIIAAPVIPATQTAFELVRPGGSLLMFSGYPAGSTMPFDLYKFHYSEKHVHGSIDCTLRDFYNAMELMPRLQMGKLITHVFPLGETPQAFRAAREVGAVKTMIEPNP